MGRTEVTAPLLFLLFPHSHGFWLRVEVPGLTAAGIRRSLIKLKSTKLHCIVVARDQYISLAHHE